MAIVTDVDLVATALWPQGDIRDPLGVWGARLIQVGDATGGSVKANIRAPAVIAGAYIYTAYSAQISNLSQVALTFIKCRLLTNWPDVDPVNEGVQGYGSNITRALKGDAEFTAPISGPDAPLINASDRFILLFDPRPVVGAFTIIELELGFNPDGVSVAFEAWGYYWDRSVMNAPGGLRHPGSA